MSVRRIRLQDTKLEARPLIHLSVAIGRFVEALFYAILRVAGVITFGVIGIVILGVLLFMTVKRMTGRNRK